MKKIIKTVSIFMCIVLLFVGCSNSSDSGGKSLFKSNNLKGTPLTIFTQQERRIWYYNHYYKEAVQISYYSRPDYILIFENGDVSMYREIKKTYGEFTEMTDDEIVNYCKTECECRVEPYNERYNKMVEIYNKYNVGDEVKKGDIIDARGYTAQYSGVIERKEELPAKRNSNLTITISRDSTGNETVAEGLKISTGVYGYESSGNGRDYEKYYCFSFDDFEKKHFKITSWTTEPQLIYSTKFATLYCSDEDSNEISATLVTKIDGDFEFDFDAPDTDFGVY